MASGSQNGARLDDNLEQLAALVVEVEQIAGEDQVAGRGDRQEFGHALDDAENQGFEQEERIHKRLSAKKRDSNLWPCLFFEYAKPAQSLLA
jgi:hypothetical protein